MVRKIYELDQMPLCLQKYGRKYVIDFDYVNEDGNKPYPDHAIEVDDMFFTNDLFTLVDR